MVWIPTALVALGWHKVGFYMILGSISVDAGTEFYIEAHRSLSWVTRLVRILLVLCSETC